MKIAFFSPLNPVETGISDYSEEMVFDLAKHFDIDLYIDQGYVPVNKEVQSHFRIIPYNPQTFDPSDYDEILYHMGNYYEGHRYIYHALKSFPGIIVLHDYVLQGFYAERYSETGDFDEYRHLLKEYYSEAGEEIATGIVERMRIPIWESEMAFKYPLNEEIIGYAKALVVHSNFVKERIQKKTSKPIVKINLHGHVIREFDTAKIRRELGIGKEDILICSAGYVNKNKRYDVIFEALSELNNPNIKYVIAGIDRGRLLNNTLQSDFKNIIIKGHLPLKDLETLISASDICINLRYPTMGESSGSLLRMMGYGKPTVVTNFGSYADFPDYCVLKVDPDIDEKEMIKRYINTLIKDADFRFSVGREAQKYIAGECSIEKCVEEYTRFIKEVNKEAIEVQKRD